RLLDALGDRGGHLLGLAVTDPDRAVAIPDHHEGGEAEATAALDDLGDPVDGHDPLDVRGLLRGFAAAALPAAPTLATTLAAALGAGTGPRAPALWTWHSVRSFLAVTHPRTGGLASARLELEPRPACGLRKRGDAPRVLVAATVEDNLADPRGLGALGDECADLRGDALLVHPGYASNRGVHTGRRD